MGATLLRHGWWVAAIVASVTVPRFALFWAGSSTPSQKATLHILKQHPGGLAQDRRQTTILWECIPLIKLEANLPILQSGRCLILWADWDLSLLRHIISTPPLSSINVGLSIGNI